MDTPAFESILDGYPVRLRNFEGPLDLLLHLIRKHEIDISDIPISLVTQQYLEYLELMQELDLEVGAHIAGAEEHGHLAQVERNGLGHAAFFRFDARVRRRRVHEADDRTAELFGHFHQAQRLAVTLGARVAEVAVNLLLGVAALLVADHQHRPAVVVGHPRHNGVIVGKAAVAVQLDEVGEQLFHVVERGRPRRVACHEHALPGGEVLVQLAADGRDPLFEPGNLAVAVVGRRQHRECLHLLEEDPDRFFELEQVCHVSAP